MSPPTAAGGSTKPQRGKNLKKGVKVQRRRKAFEGKIVPGDGKRDQALETRRNV